MSIKEKPDDRTQKLLSGCDHQMHAMVLESPQHPLVFKNLTLPSFNAQQVLMKIIACGVCRTDLHITDGELTNPKLPLIPGHEIVGVVVEKGREKNDPFSCKPYKKRWGGLFETGPAGSHYNRDTNLFVGTGK